MHMMSLNESHEGAVSPAVEDGRKEGGERERERSNGRRAEKSNTFKKHQLSHLQLPDHYLI